MARVPGGAGHRIAAARPSLRQRPPSRSEGSFVNWNDQYSLAATPALYCRYYLRIPVSYVRGKPAEVTAAGTAPRSPRQRSAAREREDRLASQAAAKGGPWWRSASSWRSLPPGAQRRRPGWGGGGDGVGGAGASRGPREGCEATRHRSRRALAFRIAPPSRSRHALDHVPFISVTSP